MATMITMSSFAGAAVGVQAGAAGHFASRCPAALRQCVVVMKAQSEDPSSLPPPKKASPSMWDALAFSGPAPERINGRLAMVGFVRALSVEAGRAEIWNGRFAILGLVALVVAEILTGVPFISV